MTQIKISTSVDALYPCIFHATLWGWRLSIHFVDNHDIHALPLVVCSYCIQISPGIHSLTPGPGPSENMQCRLWTHMWTQFNSNQVEIKLKNIEKQTFTNSSYLCIKGSTMSLYTCNVLLEFEQNVVVVAYITKIIETGLYGARNPCWFTGYLPATLNSTNVTLLA